MLRKSGCSETKKRNKGISVLYAKRDLCDIINAYLVVVFIARSVKSYNTQVNVRVLNSKMMNKERRKKLMGAVSDI
jgi:TFIIF-interacting CTD phosphatase-like protein